MLQLKHIDDNLYIIDTEVEIKEMDYYLHLEKGILSEQWSQHISGKFEWVNVGKIIAQLKDQLSGVPLFDLPDENMGVLSFMKDLVKKHRDTHAFVAIMSDEINILSTQTLQQYDGKQVEIEIEENQCDGCNSNIPIENGIHKSPYPSGSMVCQKHKYNKITIIKIL